MQGQHSHGVAYYRCRFPKEYALGNKIDHPSNVFLREELLITPLDTWLVQQFSPLLRRHTIAELVAQAQIAAPAAVPSPAGPTIANCDAKLARYRAALEAGADPTVVASWIAEAQTERRHAEQRLQEARSAAEHAVPQLSEELISTIIDELGGLVEALREAAPEDKLEVYRNLDLRLTYNAENRTVRAEIDLAAHRGDLVCVRRGT